MIGFVENSCPNDFVMLVLLIFRGVAQSGLARLVRDQEAGGSNPLTPKVFITR